MLKRFLWSVALALLLLTTFALLAQAAVPPIEGMGGAISVVMSTDAGLNAKRHLYVAGRDENAIAYFEQQADGSLSFVDAYYDGEGGIDGLHYVSEIALSPDNEHLYAVGRLADSLVVFDRDPATGALTFVQVLKDDENGVDGLHEASGVTVSPDGKHVYATAGYDSQISIFSRDAATGLLTYVGLLEDGVNGVDGLGGSFPILVSPDNQHVYVGGGLDNAIAVFTRDSTSGALGFTQVITAGVNNARGLQGVSGLAGSLDGQSLYAASFGPGLGDQATVAAFSRNAATGELTFVATYKNQAGGGTIPGLWGALAVDVSPDGNNVYATGLFGSALVAFNRNTGTSALTHQATFVQDQNNVKGLTYARDVIVDPSGANVYAISRIDNAVAWFIRNGGALTFTDHYRKPIGVADGAQKGLTNYAHNFTAKVRGSAPFTYLWQTSDGQTVGPVAGQLSNTATFQWATPGQRTVNVTATNRDGVFQQTLTIDVKANFTSADQAALPKTGQTQCYNSQGAAITCADTGQDGDKPTGVALAKPRFVKGNGTVTDTGTGLVWLQNANCISTDYPAYDTHNVAGDGMVTWQMGLTFVKGINSGAYPTCGAGYTDWRLPNVRELQSLVDFGIGTPVVPNTAGTGPWTANDPFTNLVSKFYWSSSSDEGVPGPFTINGSTWRGWAVSMETGATWADDKGGTGIIFGHPMGHVWPVRGQTAGAAAVAQSGQQTCYETDGNFIPCPGSGQDGEKQAGVPIPSPRFVIGSGVVTDTQTGLVWLQNADCINSQYPAFDNHNIAGDGIVTWQQGLNFIKGINVGNYPNCSAGYNQWRLPNIRELQSLVDFGLGGPIIADTSGIGKWTAGNPFINVKNSLYWSSTSDGHTPATSAGRAWAIGGRTGATWPDLKDGSGADFGFPMGRVWPVLDTRSASNQLLYVSSSVNGVVAGVAYQDEDILAYDAASGSWSLVFDGSNVGVAKTDVDAFHLWYEGNAILMSFSDPINLPVLGLVDDSDIVKFTPTSLGAGTTAGSFELYFDGSDVELTSSGEDIDALSFSPDGKLLISTEGTATVAGIKAGDEDLLAFMPTVTGANTSGVWYFYFDGSSVGLTQGNEDVDGVGAADGALYLTTKGNFTANSNGTQVNGKGADIFRCTPLTLGNATMCKFELAFTQATLDFAKNIDDLAVTAAAQQTLTAASVQSAEGVQYETAAEERDAADAELDAFDGNEEETNQKLFLPMIAQQ